MFKTGIYAVSSDEHATLTWFVLSIIGLFTGVFQRKDLIEPDIE